MDAKEWKDLENLISSLLISNPLQMTIRSLNNDFRNEIGYDIPYEKFGFRTLEQCLDNMTQVLERDGSYITVRVSSKSAHIDKLVARQVVPSTKKFQCVAPNKQRRRYAVSNNYESRNELLDYIPPLIPETGVLMSPPANISQNLSSIQLNKHKTKSKSFSQLHGCDLKRSTQNNLQKFYFEHVSTQNTKRNCLHPPKNDAVDWISSNRDRLVRNSKVPLDVQKNLIELISKYDQGIRCCQLPEAYQNLFKKELDCLKYQYKNLILMCMELDKIFCCERVQGEFVVYDRDKLTFNSNFVAKSRQTSTVTKVEKSINTVALEVLQSFETVTSQFTLCKIKHGDSLEVSVAEIYNPKQFFVILTEKFSELDNLMDALQIFYTKRSCEFSIPKHMITINLYCVTLYNNEYHRAKIVDVSTLSNSTVKVFCFDYGTLDNVKLTDIYYLHKRFAKLPQQAIKAQLAHINSLQYRSEWPKDASLRFLALTREKDLMAQVINVDYENQTLNVVLADKRGTDGLLNDVLVNEKFALKTSEHTKIGSSYSKKSSSRKILLKSLQQLHAKKI